MITRLPFLLWPASQRAEQRTTRVDCKGSHYFENFQEKCTKKTPKQVKGASEKGIYLILCFNVYMFLCLLLWLGNRALSSLYCFYEILYGFLQLIKVVLNS